MRPSQLCRHVMLHCQHLDRPPEIGELPNIVLEARHRIHRRPQESLPKLSSLPSLFFISRQSAAYHLPRLSPDIGATINYSPGNTTNDHICTRITLCKNLDCFPV